MAANTQRTMNAASYDSVFVDTFRDSVFIHDASVFDSFYCVLLSRSL